MTVFVGTSGFSYPEWIGPVYPDGTPKSRMLEAYAKMFDIVEINATFYRPPGPKMFEKYPERTGGKMKVMVKLHSAFTHERDPDQNTAKLFDTAVKPLEESGQFSGYLAQFPQSFYNSNDAGKYIEYLKKLFPEAPLVVEFRHKSWWNDEVYDFLRDLNVSMATIDAPQVSQLPPPDLVKTAEPAYVRLHGRNAENWYGQGMEPRYTYKYDRETIKSWVSKVKKIYLESGETFILFNNHPHGNAPVNANEFLEILREVMPDALPAPRPEMPPEIEQGMLF